MPGIGSLRVERLISAIKSRAVQVAAAGVLLLPLISGCGGSASSATTNSSTSTSGKSTSNGGTSTTSGNGTGGSTTSTPDYSSLNGNWLVVGDMPQIPLYSSSGPNFGISATLDVVNSQVYGELTVWYPCPTWAGSTATATYVAAVPIAADGSFTLTNQSTTSTSPVVVTIQGHATSGAGANWSGSYTATNSNTGCNPMSGSFTAAAIQPITGNFSGSATIAASGSSTPVNASVQVNLQQGGPSSLDPSAYQVANSVNALSGTITIGPPCASTGTLTIPAGSVLGNYFQGTFVMSDGSHLAFGATANDSTLSSIQLLLAEFSGGPCDKWGVTAATNLAKQ